MFIVHRCIILTLINFFIQPMMIMKNKPFFLISIATAAMLLSGCNLPARQTTNPVLDINTVATSVALTLESLNTATPLPDAASPTIDPGKASTSTPKATKTLAATITPTYSAPILTFDNNVNCRQGPGTNFKVVVLIKEGQKVDVVGVQDKFWIVKVPGSTETCWLPAEFATPEGSVWTVPTIGAPDTPTEVPPFAPIWKKWNYFCSFSNTQTTLVMEMEWTDKNGNESGFRVLRDGESIAELGPDATSFSDTVTVENGQSFDYSIEVFRGTAKATSSVVNASCQ